MSLRRSGYKKLKNNKLQSIQEENNENKSDDSLEEIEEDIDDFLEETPQIKQIKQIKEDEDKELNKYKDIGDYIIEKSYLYINNTFSYIYYALKIMVKVSGVYLMWIILHYGASHLYIQLCVPKTPWGFLISPFLTATPHCQGLRWIVYNAANVINNMWVILGAWVCSTILLINRDNTEHNI